ncbi:hypothetical protein BB560_001490 [Smittium megazygosporum]|uniref:GST N-terminal domain-containing protein n=1 Tax=Smittium megazygosporum TaxID=133381 RepID=A0A2T9ZHE3_9FUNG|nr:hypothetical protein BB560_001490 [Smittium megazygosporum]
MSYPHSKTLMTLYAARVCPFAQRAVWALKEAKAEYEIEFIDLKNKPSWYSLVNPLLKVPTLRLPDGQFLYESLLVARFVADKYPESGLMPSDPLARYNVDYFIERVGDLILKPSFEIARAPSEERVEKANEVVKNNLVKINTMLLERDSKNTGGNKGPYVLGSQFTLAEICTLTFLSRLELVFSLCNLELNEEMASKLGVDLSRFFEWRNAVFARPAYIESAPATEIIRHHYAPLMNLE